LLRQLSYWSDTDVNLYILDGSDEPISSKLKELVNVNCKYVYSLTGFNERLFSATQLVTTKYVAVLCDDELYAKAGLIDCLRKLDTDPYLIGCSGRSILFHYRDGEIYGRHAYEKARSTADSFGDGLQRMKNGFHHGDPSNSPDLVFSVIRREQWLKIFSVAYARTYGSGYVYEFAALLVGLYLGPIAVIDSLVWFRSGENPPVTQDNSVIRKVGMGEWGSSPQYEDEYNDFIFRISSTLELEKKHSQDEVEATVRQLSEQFFAYSIYKKKRLIAKWHKTLYFIFKLTPQGAKDFVKRIMTKRLSIILGYNGVEFLNTLKDMRFAEVSFDDVEMSDLRKFLLEFHEQLSAK